MVEDFERDGTAEAVLDRRCSEVHHEAESSERTSALDTGSETRAGYEMYALSRDSKQKLRLLVIGRENATAGRV